MKSKEEILWLKPQPEREMFKQKYVMEAMDEYAKQEAIEFWRFCLKYNYQLAFASEEIYNLYLQSKTLTNV